MIQNTSLIAFIEEHDLIKTQETMVYDLMVKHPEGITDKTMATLLNIPDARISARRYGLQKKGHRINSYKATSEHTGKLVNWWYL